MKTWKKTNLDYLERFYKKAAEAWKEEHDDRRMLSNIYYMLHEAIESLDDDPHIIVRVAMNRHLNSRYDMMNEIKKRFAEMGLYVK